MLSPGFLPMTNPPFFNGGWMDARGAAGALERPPPALDFPCFAFVLTAAYNAVLCGETRTLSQLSSGAAAAVAAAAPAGQAAVRIQALTCLLHFRRAGYQSDCNGTNAVPIYPAAEL